MSALEFGFGNGTSYSPSFKSFKTQKRSPWTTACKAFCVGQMLGGVVVCFLSAFHLFSSTLYMGLILGVLLFAVGAIGLLGTHLAHRDLLNFHLVGAILGIIVSFQFISLVWRQVDVDCSLAELYIKTNILEDLSRDFAHETVFDSVYKRMNEMEDMLDAMHYGLGKTMDSLRNKPSDVTLDADKHFLKTKLDVIKFHANKILQDMQSHPEITDETVAKWPEQDRKYVEQKYHTALVVLQEIQRHEDDSYKNPLDSKRYEELLLFVTNAAQVSSIPGQHWEHDTTELKQLKEELPHTKSIVEKVHDSIHVLDKIAMDNSQLAEATRNKLEAYRNQFVALMEQERRDRNHDHHADMLRLMPEHCVEESKAVSYMGFVGVTVVAFQLSTIYSSLCVSFRLPIKAD